MFNANFYPTPRDVAKMMFARLTREPSEYALVVDPSAGKGDLLEAWVGDEPGPIKAEDYETVEELRRARFERQIEWRERSAIRKNLRAIEIEPDLCAILREKEYRVVGNDFMAWDNREMADLFIMNPPFSAGDLHVLHAWKCLPGSGGEVVALLNAETIRNCNSATRYLLADIIREHGSVEYIGQVFKNAERPTDVEVALVHLVKERQESSLHFDFDNPYDVPEGLAEDGNLIQQVAPGGALERLEQTILAASQQWFDMLKAAQKYGALIEPFVYDDESAEALFPNRRSIKNPRGFYDSAMSDLNSRAWQLIFRHPQFGLLMTRRIREDFEKFKKEQLGIQFTAHNVRQMILALGAKSESIRQEVVEEVFDKLTSYDSDNKCHTEGWKTNSGWKINRKVIIPWNVTWSYSHWSLRDWDTLDDIDRAMCVADNAVWSNVTTIRNVIQQNDRMCPFCFDSTYFKVRVYKKGTIHLTFLNEKVWEQFNLMAAKAKKWIGDG